MKRGIIDLVVVIVTMLIIFCLAYFIYDDEKGTSLQFDCNLIVLFMSGFEMFSKF